MGLYGASYTKTLLTSLILSSVVVVSASDGEVENLPICGNNGEDSTHSKNLLFISTLDGQITALDARDGTEKWHLQAVNPLLSSSIHRLELSNGGQWVRLVPSLGGSLYRFSGDSLEPLPLSADQLLSSSYKYSDDLVIAGGKETVSMGVSTGTGKLIYECNLSGCVNSTNMPSARGEQNQDDSEELLLIRRVQQTVRAIEPRTGQERWNFSVGQHQLSLQPFKGCVLPPSPVQSTESDFTFRVVVPEGLICAVQKTAPNNIIWKHKLNTPIVGAWGVEHNKLYSIDLFGAAFVPSRSLDSLPDEAQNSPDFAPSFSPAVYVGMHDRQLYIQESVRMQALVQSHTTMRSALGHDHQSPALIIPWKPVPARSLPEWDPHDTDVAMLVHEKEYATTALSVLYASEYVNGNGYYLFTNDDRKMIYDPTCDVPNTSIAEIGEDQQSSDPGLESSHRDEFEWSDDEPIHIFVVSLWFWWKEVAVIALSTAICLNVLSHKFRRKFTPPEVHRHYVLVERKVQIVPQPSTSIVESQESTPPPFSSRYLTDFTPVQCLGRGGFGIVFEAKNKIDDCSYAIKRITLPIKKDKRERVLREVRALAKLEHSHIVRYFNAWLEEPPVGWQDPFESELKSGMDFTDTYSKLPIRANIDNNKSLLSNYKEKNVCLSIQPELSESCDNSASNKFNTRLKDIDFSRQRSYSMNDSFSIVFEKSFQDRSRDQSSCNRLNESFTNDGEEDEDSFIIFDEPDKKTDRTKSGDSIISISDSDFQIKPPQLPAHINETQVVCINESQEYKKSKKGHRRNLSLDLKSTSSKSPEFLGKMYLYIQMQLCRPESLRDWLRENTSLEVRKLQVVTIFEQIVDAVEYVHLQGLIHRDLKPSNIFFAVDGRIKVGDFGLVTAMADPLLCGTDQPRSPVLGMPDVVHDKHTLLVGTHLYMSPEQLHGEAHGYKVDIWSLGLVLAELLIPFNTEMERITTLKALREHRFPQDFQTNFPQEHSLLLLMLSMEPSRRPTTLGVRARAPLLHRTDPRHHFSLPPRTSLRSTSSA